MLNRKTLVSVIATVCCADMAFGAASLRIGGTQNATGTTARAETLRTGSVKLADVTPKSSVSGGTATPTTIGRLATSTGGSSVGNSHGRISGHGSGASAAALDELERRVNALTDDYGRLDGQYDRLSNDVNYAATTATSANTGINNLRTRVDTVEGKITGLENQGVDTATINGLIDNKIGNFPTKNEVTTQIHTASEALRDYADSTGMTETERQELTRLSSAVDTKLSISDAENTYATKTQLDNAIVGNESVLADYVQTTYANAHFATKPEVNALTTALNNKVDATYVTNKINEAQIEGSDVDVSVFYKKDEADELFETQAHAVNTYANKVTTENALLQLNTMNNKITDAESNIDTLEETVGSHATSIASLGQNKLDKNDDVISKITTNETNIAALQTAKTTIENDIDALSMKLENKATKEDVSAVEAAAKEYADRLAISGGDLSPEEIEEKVTSIVQNNMASKADKSELETARADLAAAIAAAQDEADALLANKINTETANATFETQTHAADTYANKVTTENALSQLNTNMANKVTETQLNAAIAAAQLDGGDVDLSGYYNKDEADALFETQTHATDTYANKVTTENTLSQLSADVANKINTEIANATFETQTHAADTYANKETTENALSQLNTNMANKVTETQLNAAIAEAELGELDDEAVRQIVQDVMGDTTAFVTTQTYNTYVTSNDAAVEGKLNKSDLANELGKTANTNAVNTIINNNSTVAGKASQSALDTLTGRVTANETAIAALPNEDRVAQIAADAANAAALCAGGRIETQESTVGGKTVINVNCVTDD